MKMFSHMVIIAGLLLAQSSFACQKEAQVIGTVSAIAKVTNHGATLGCYFQAKFTHYLPSGVCPLAQEEIQGELIEDQTCSLKIGDTASGVLVQDAETSLRLEM